MTSLATLLQSTYDGHPDMQEGEVLFGLESVLVWPESGLESPSGAPALAAFHGPECDCGRPFGISYDPDMIRARGENPNVVLLHELVHAWQWSLSPDRWADQCAAELTEHGYWDAPFEVEARHLARALNDAGVRVWIPNTALG